MTRKMNLKPFTSFQQEYIKRGKLLTDQLTEKVIHSLGKSQLKHNPKKNHYIAGPSGTGKSVTVRETAKKHHIELVEITGVTSMSALAITLACSAFLSQGEDIFIWLDDCDSIFMDRVSLSVMKGALDKDRNIFAWNKNLTSQIQAYERSNAEQDKIIAKALREYQPIGNVGVEIPTENMTFIITSNHFLKPSNPPPKTSRGKDEAAVRSRVAYTEYNLDANTSWGWIASITLSNKILGLTVNQKHILLDWMFTNWNNLPDTDMRAVEELAADMLNYPNNYPDHWETRLNVIR